MVPYVWNDHTMEMKLHNLKNREGGRESSHNRSFQGWKVEEIDAFAEKLAAKDNYVWESETKQLVLNLHVSGKTPGKFLRILELRPSNLQLRRF